VSTGAAFATRKSGENRHRERGTRQRLRRGSLHPARNAGLHRDIHEVVSPSPPCASERSCRPVPSSLSGHPPAPQQSAYSNRPPSIHSGPASETVLHRDAGSPMTKSRSSSGDERVDVTDHQNPAVVVYRGPSPNPRPQGRTPSTGRDPLPFRGDSRKLHPRPSTAGLAAATRRHRPQHHQPRRRYPPCPPSYSSSTNLIKARAGLVVPVRRTSTHVTVCLLLAVSPASCPPPGRSAHGARHHAERPRHRGGVTTEECDAPIVCKGFT
jgi:hypothetical protein